MEEMGMSPVTQMPTFEPLLVGMPTSEPVLVDEQQLNDFNVLGNEITTEEAPARAQDILINPRASSKGLWTIGNINSSSSAPPQYSFIDGSSIPVVANHQCHQTMDGSSSNSSYKDNPVHCPAVPLSYNNHPTNYPAVPLSYSDNPIHALPVMSYNDNPFHWPAVPPSYSNHPIHSHALPMRFDDRTYGNTEQLSTFTRGLSWTKVQGSTYTNTGQLFVISQGLSRTHVNSEQYPPSHTEISTNSCYNTCSSAQGTNAFDRDPLFPDYDCSFDDLLDFPSEHNSFDLPDPFCHLSDPSKPNF